MRILPPWGPVISVERVVILDILFWRAKAVIERLPGARHLHTIYKRLTSLVGEGRIYTIARGPMRGVRWRRYNRLPYWYHTGRYEPHVSEFILGHLRPGDVLWDLGANAGYHALAGARAVGPDGFVLAIEPDPDTAAILREQLALNRVESAAVIEAAVADRSGTMMLVVREYDRRGDSLEAVHTPGIDNADGNRIPVKVTTLDALAQRYPAPTLLKVDIEGAETLVLPAARAFFEGEHRPAYVLLAYHGLDLREPCAAYLRAYGYHLEPWPGRLVDEDAEYGTLIAVAPAAVHGEHGAGGAATALR